MATESKLGRHSVTGHCDLLLLALQVIDTGAVLLESACGVDRVHEALAATMPMVPGCRYFRWEGTIQ